VGIGEAAVAEKNGRRIVANARNAKAVRREEAIFMTAPANLSCVIRYPCRYPCVQSWNSSCQAIWMGFQLAFVGCLRIACEVGQLGGRKRCRSVKRTSADQARDELRKAGCRYLRRRPRLAVWAWAVSSGQTQVSRFQSFKVSEFQGFKIPRSLCGCSGCFET